MTHRLRVVLAGASKAPLSKAAEAVLRAEARVELVAVAHDRLVPGDAQRLDADLLISAAHPFMISEQVLAGLRLGAVGLHPSLLPRNRGSYPLWWTLRRHEQRTGLSLFHLTSRVDAGPVIDQRVVGVQPWDTFESLYERVADLVPEMLVHLITTVARTGELPRGSIQDESLATYVRRPRAFERVLAKTWWTVRAGIRGVVR